MLYGDAEEDALTNMRGAARAPVGNLTSPLVECVALVKEAAFLVIVGDGTVFPQ
jgi:hypothetical protein